MAHGVIQMSQPRLGGTTQVVLESMVSVFAVCAEGLRYLARIRWCRLQSNSPKNTLPSWCVISDTHRIISRRRSTDAAHCQSSRNDLLQAKVHLVRAGSASSLVRSPGAATRYGSLAVDQARFLVLVSVIDLRAGIPVEIATPNRVPRPI